MRHCLKFEQRWLDTMNNYTLISDLYYHTVEDMSNKPKKRNNKENRLKSCETVQTLETLLNEEGKVVLHKLLDQWMDLEVASNEESFTLGFRTGAKLMREILETDSTLS